MSYDFRLHRDDLPMEEVQRLEKLFGEMFPGMKLTFAGDAPEGTPVPEGIAEFEERMAESLEHGVCFKCGAKYPEEYPPTPGSELPGDWHVITSVSGAPMAVDCGCDEQLPGGAHEVVVEESVTDVLLRHFSRLFLHGKHGGGTLEIGSKAHISALRMWFASAFTCMKIYHCPDADEIKEVLMEICVKGWEPEGKWLQ